MTDFTVAMLCLILVLVALAYSRSAGQDEAKQMRHELEALRAWQRKFAESLAESLARAYDRSRQRLEMIREHLLGLREEAVEGLEQQVKHANDQVDELARRLDEKAEAAKDATLKTAQAVERAIGIRVRQVQALTDLTRAKSKVNHAVDAAEKRDFDRAGQFQSQDTDSLRDARKALGGDLACNELLFLIKWKLRDATAAVRSQADNIRHKIERVLTDAGQIVVNLESYERVAAGKSP